MPHPKKKTVLILGASGFTGRHLVQRLLQDDRYRLLTPGRQDLPLGDCARFRDIILRDHPDTIINLAGQAHATEGDMAELYRLNAFAVRDMLNILHDMTFTGRFIQAGSGNIYGRAYHRPVAEDDLPVPANDYGCSKVLVETFCGLFSEDLDICVTRPFSGIGRGQAPNFLVPKIADHFRRNAPEIELGNIEVQRDFIDIRDVAAAYQILLEGRDVPSPVIIGSGQTHSIRDLLEGFGRLAGYDIAVKVNPAFIRPKDLLYQCADIRKMTALGWTPRYTFDKTLKWIFGATENRTE